MRAAPALLVALALALAAHVAAAPLHDGAVQRRSAHGSDDTVSWDDDIASMADDPTLRSFLILVGVLGGVVIVLAVFAAAIRFCALASQRAVALNHDIGAEALRTLMSDHESRDDASDARRRTRAME